MAFAPRIFPAQGPGATFNARYLALGSSALIILLFGISLLARHDASKIVALERKLAMLEAKEEQMRLSMAQEVQKALQSDLSMMMAGGHTLTGGSRTYPAVLHLPAHLQKRILLTGGAGFVGSHLLDALLLQGHSVTVLDNLFTGRMANIQHWSGACGWGAAGLDPPALPAACPPTAPTANCTLRRPSSPPSSHRSSQLPVRAARRDGAVHDGGGSDLPPCLPRKSAALPVQPHQDDQDQHDGHHEHAGPRQAHLLAPALHEHVGGVWRPGGAPTGALLPELRLCMRFRGLLVRLPDAL